MSLKFFIPYFGSKKRELSQIMPIINDLIEKSDIVNVCECFSGSWIISQQIFNNYDDRIKIHISDVDYLLVKFCNNIFKNKN